MKNSLVIISPYFYLMREVGAQLQHPVPPLLYGDAHTSPTLYSDGAQRVILRQLNHQLDEDVIHRVGSDHLSCCRAGFDLGQKDKDTVFIVDTGGLLVR